MTFRIGLKQLAQVCRRVGTSLRAGVDIVKVWEMEANHGPPQKRQEMLAVRERIAQGEPVADAMIKSKGFFPPLACEMVEVGEQTGKLDQAFLRLAEHYEHILDLRRQFITGITWPAIELIGGIAVVGLLILFLGVIGGPIDPFGFGLGLSGLINYLLFVALIAGVITWATMAVLRGWFGFDRALHGIIRLPVVGTCFQTMALSRLAWTLSMALEAGIDARRAIRMALRSTQSPFYKRHVPAVDRAIIEGREFHEALRPTGVFPDEFLNSLEAAELSGTGAETLDRLAKDYQDRAQVALRVLTVVASFLLGGLVALILVFVIIKMAMALYLGPLYDALGDIPGSGY